MIQAYWGGLSSGVEIITFMFRFTMSIIKWPFQRGWSLIKMASQKGFHCMVFWGSFNLV